MRKIYEYGPDKRPFIVQLVGLDRLRIHSGSPFSSSSANIYVNEEEGVYTADFGDMLRPYPSVELAVEAVCKHLAVQEDRVKKLRTGLVSFVSGLKDESA